MRSLRIRPAAWIAASVVFFACGNLPGQSFRHAGTEFEALRPVSIPAGQTRPIMVTEFLHHGQISPDGKNVVVVAKNNELAPLRVLQLGPGDFCRLAFETLPRETNYEILYGGQAPSKDAVSAWTNPDGLLLDTRRFKQCDLNRFESVREAFDAAEPIGADYVDQVGHSCNPLTLGDEPFLSRYTGQLHVAAPMTAMFWTSSQDCSFLRIDGKTVVESPGRHGPLYQAQPGMGRTVELSTGTHKFEYYHAAAGPEAMMVAAWAVAPRGDKPQPTAIPPEAFRAGSIGRVAAGTVTTRAAKLTPDFQFAIVGDVPLPDNPIPLVGVAFKDASAQGLTMKAKVLWDFGDGQTSEDLNPGHVYLHPGVYRVTLSVKHSGRDVETTNRIAIDRPRRTPGGKEKTHSLDDYLPTLEKYDPARLDAVALGQLVAAHQWKSENVLQAKADEDKKKQDAAEQPEEENKDSGKKPRRRPTSEEKRAEAKAKEELDAVEGEARRHLVAAVEAGKAAFAKASAAKGDEDLFKLAQRVGPMARVALGDAPLAMEIWTGAAGKIADARLQAECQARAADVAVSDLLDAARAKPLLDAAAATLGKDKPGAAASELERVWGDYHALRGDGKAARAAYLEAQRLLDARQSQNERTAWQGAHSRSTEEFLMSGQWARALEELQAWQREFPAEKIDGYLTLLYARYWAGRKKHDQAISLAEQLIAVNPASPYADQLLMLSAECETQRGRTDRAAATLNSLLKDYPGSPLVPAAKEKLEALK
jgi:predicted negative regulator of RcsB-dependent stress response